MYTLKELQAQLAPVISSVEMICVPTAPRHYKLEEVLADPIETNSALGSYTNFVNLLDLCGIAVPVAKRVDGLPMSVTFLATGGRDEQVAAMALRAHQEANLTLGATSWPLEAAILPKAIASQGELEIVVVGAHLSGMPLNNQLVNLGGKFLRRLKTTPQYRLFVLPDQQIPKPGLMRVSGATGSAIEVEVWSLPEMQFAQFVLQYLTRYYCLLKIAIDMKLHQYQLKEL
jgi:allophanate hydrolase